MQPPDPLGRDLSHYRLLARLGEGGMGTVYRAEDTRLGRVVALKVLRLEDVGGAEARERLKREARACVSLHHPNITQVYEVGEADDVCFIAMELVEGRTLRALLASETLAWPRVVGIGRQVAAALGRAHRQGLVHRDVKPENIMVTAGDHVKVLDFGLVRRFDTRGAGGSDAGKPRLTSAGTIVGTVAYMSPEQAQGHDVGPAGDVFSLGIVLYEMAAGRPPFTGPSIVHVLYEISMRDPEPIRDLRPDVPPAFERLVERALRKRPERRFANGAALEQEFAALADTLATGAPEAATVRVPAAAPHAPAGRLIGRQAELRLLREAVHAASAEGGRAVWIAGEAGAGKSRFLQEALARAAGGGAAVLYGACRNPEGAVPYQPVAEALLSFLGLSGSPRREDLAERLEADAPGLGRRAAEIAHLVQAASADAGAFTKEQVFDATAQLLASLSERRPVVLALDDLHWADPGTLELVQHLVRQLRRQHVLLVGTYRPEDLHGAGGAPHPLARLLERAERDAASTRLVLGRLTGSESAELAEELAGLALPPGFLHELHERTDGNAFFVVEVVHMLRDAGALDAAPDGTTATRKLVALFPPRVRDVLKRRFAGLAPRQLELLQAAAVQGAVFDPAVLRATSSLSPEEIDHELDALEHRLRLIHAEPDGYHFDHALIRDALRDELAVEESRRLHRVVGGHLRTTYGDRPERAAAIAYHFVQAAEGEEALPFLVTAARVARRLFANESAIEHLDAAERILRERTEDCDTAPARTRAALMDVYDERGTLHSLVGRYREALDDFRRLEQHATDAGDGARMAAALNRRAHVLYLRGDYDPALAAARGARRLAHDAGDDLGCADAAAIAGLVHFQRGAFDDALAEHRESIERRRRLGDRMGVAHDLNKIGNIHYYSGRYRDAQTAYGEALAAEKDLDDRRGMAESLMNLGAVFLQLGDNTASVRHHTEALALKREVGDRRSVAMSLNNLALTHELMGELAEARRYLEESLAVKREIGDQRGLSTSLSNLAVIHEKMGEFERALEAAEESLAVKLRIEDHMSMPYALNAVGAVLAVFGQYDAAAMRHEEALRIAREVGDRAEQARSTRYLAELTAGRGELDAACARLEEAVALAREIGVREGEMEALAALADVEIRRGRLDAAERAIDGLASLAAGRPEFGARAARLEGLLSAASDRPAEAIARLGRALNDAAAIGLKDLQWRVHADLSRVHDRCGAAAEAEEEKARARLVLDELAEQIVRPDLRAGFLERSEALLSAPARPTDTPRAAHA